MGKNKNAKQKPLTPEQYIKTKARQLPIHQCIKATNVGDTHAMSIIVARKHPQGTISMAAFLIDRWCLGIKDALWYFSIDEYNYNRCLNSFKDHHDKFEKIDYVEAHNWVYGAHDFAAEAGIQPCHEFNVAQYLLEPDDDATELIEYDFGKNGKHCLMVQSNLEASKYTKTLDATLGKGNYDIIISPLDDDDYDDEDFDDDDFDDYDDDDIDDYDDEDLDDEYYQKPFFSTVPSMEYTYVGKDYPTEIKLHHPEIETIIAKDTDDISDSEIGQILSLPPTTLREDLHNQILFQLGRQSGKTQDELDEDLNCLWPIIGNSLIFLTQVGTIEDTLPVVLEVLRQNDDVLDFNICDMGGLLIQPVLYQLCKNKPSSLLPFMLEAGLTTHAKNIVSEVIEAIGTHNNEVRNEVIDLVRELLIQYTADLPNRTICDGTIAGFIISIATSMGLKELWPKIESIYDTGLVDEFIEGDISDIYYHLYHPYEPPRIPPLTPREIIKEIQSF